MPVRYSYVCATVYIAPAHLEESTPPLSTLPFEVTQPNFLQNR